MRDKNRRYKDGTGSESTENSKDAESAQVTHDLVKRAEAKLVGLHTDRSQLRKRIRALHYLLKTIRTECSSSESDNSDILKNAAETTFDDNARLGYEEASRSPVASQNDAPPTGVTSPLPGLSTELRRACRIALMETDQPQCCDQILHRIRRRQSVCIAGIDDPMTVIASALRSMLVDGEVIFEKDDQRWQLNRDTIAQRRSAHK